MKVFVSYTREKDQFDEVVSTFRERLEAELRLRDESATVFQDKSVIASGDNFPEVLATHLACSDVLVVLLSPAWLKSKWCQREFELFVTAEAGRGRPPRILPLLWVSTSLSQPQPDDPIANQIAKQLQPLQYSNWRDLRKRDWKSEALKNEVDLLADRIYELAAGTGLSPT
jgi:hypothetical protein